MVTRYISKREKISSYLKDNMASFPNSPLDYKVYLSQVAFKLDVKEQEVEKVLETFVTLGNFEIIDNKIVSVIAQEKERKRNLSVEDVETTEILTDNEINNILSP